MAVLAQGLPVVLVPEQVSVPAVWHDVINDSSGAQLSPGLAKLAKRVPLQVSFPGSTPSGVISALVRALSQVSATVQGAIDLVRQGRAGWMPAGAVWFSGHTHLTK